MRRLTSFKLIVRRVLKICLHTMSSSCSHCSKIQKIWLKQPQNKKFPPILNQIWWFWAFPNFKFVRLLHILFFHFWPTVCYGGSNTARIFPFSSYKIVVCFKAQKMASPAKKNSPVENQDKLVEQAFADL